MDMLHKAHKKKRTIVLAAIIIALVVFLTGVNIGNKQAASGDGISLTGYAVASLKGSPDVLLPVEISVAVDRLEIPIHSDLELSTTGVVIKTDDSTIRINNENKVSLKEFRGKMYWNESVLTIEGKAKQYFGQNTNIDWTRVKKVKLDVLQGSVVVKVFEVDDLTMFPIGTVMIEKNILTLDEQELILRDFLGSFDVSLNQSEVRLKMVGGVSSVRVNGEDYSILIK